MKRGFLRMWKFKEERRWDTGEGLSLLGPLVGEKIMKPTVIKH